MSTNDPDVPRGGHRPGSRRLACAVASLAAVWLTVAGCGDKRPKDGSERGDCYGNGTCDQGLICLSNLCVRPPPADCDKVVKKLGYIALGNYTPHKVRDEFHKRLTTVCRGANLTKSQGDCILAARTKRELARCDKPLVFADCQRMFDHVKKVIGVNEPDILRRLTKDPDRALRKCKDELYTKADEACVLAAQTKQDLQACNM